MNLRSINANYKIGAINFLSNGKKNCRRKEQKTNKDYKRNLMKLNNIQKS